MDDRNKVEGGSSFFFKFNFKRWGFDGLESTLHPRFERRILNWGLLDDFVVIQFFCVECVFRFQPRCFRLERLECFSHFPPLFVANGFIREPDADGDWWSFEMRVWACEDCN